MTQYSLNPLLFEKRFLTTWNDIHAADKLAKQRAQAAGQKYSAKLYRNKNERQLFKQALNDVKNNVQ